MILLFLKFVGAIKKKRRKENSRLDLSSSATDPLPALSPQLLLQIKYYTIIRERPTRIRIKYEYLWQCPRRSPVYIHVVYTYTAYIIFLKKEIDMRCGLLYPLDCCKAASGGA